MSTAIFNNVNLTGVFKLTGSSDAIQLKVVGNATQTTNPFQITTSAAANIFSVSNAGVINVISGTSIRPSANGTAAINFATNGGTSIFNVDTTNSRIGIGTTAPAYQVDATTGIRSRVSIYAKNTGSVGSVNLVTGDTNTGYIEWRLPAADGASGTRLGYMGYDLNNVTLTLQNSANFIMTGGLVSVGTAGTGLFNITGSTDVVQLKIIANGTQTNDVFETLASDGTTKTTHVNGTGYFGVGNMTSRGLLHTQMTTAQGAPVAPRFERLNTTLNTIITSAAIEATSTGDMVDGFGTMLEFDIRDTANVDNPIAQIGAVRAGADNTGDLVFRTFAAGTAGEKMRITSAGNVGIGTTAPSTKLHVLGTTEQLRLGYDASNYKSETVGSTGSVTTALTGTTPVNIFSQVIRGNGGFQSSDGSAGATGSFTTVDLKTVTVKNGLITAIV